MNLFAYFDLDIMQSEPVLGDPKKSVDERRRKRQRERVLMTILMYAGVFLGVLGENFLTLSQKKPGASLEPFQLITALIISTTIFPAVFPKLFGKMRGPMYGNETLAPQLRFVQFCVAFQNGFFWQTLIRLLANQFT